MIDDFNATQIQDKYPDIEWSFSHPYTPHTNGAIERMVGLVKRGLEALLSNKDLFSLNDQMFQTLATRVEGILNSRPLTYTCSGPDDLQPITPNDFLLPACAREMPPMFGDDDKSKHTKWLRTVDDLLTQLWNRFVSEYLPMLHGMNRWRSEHECIKEGDVVLVLDKGVGGRGKYPLGMVVKTYPDAQGRVRSIDVSSNKKLLQRHIRGVAKLFTHEGELKGTETDEPDILNDSHLLGPLQEDEPEASDSRNMDQDITPLRRSSRRDKTQEEHELEPMLEDEDDPLDQVVKPEESIMPVKRGRGRPRKNPVQVQATSVSEDPEVTATAVVVAKRKRGRPRKLQ
jgi:hypothetical protein